MFLSTHDGIRFNWFNIKVLRFRWCPRAGSDSLLKINLETLWACPVIKESSLQDTEGTFLEGVFKEQGIVGCPPPWWEWKIPSTLLCIPSVSSTGPPTHTVSTLALLGGTKYGIFHMPKIAILIIVCHWYDNYVSWFIWAVFFSKCLFLCCTLRWLYVVNNQSCRSCCLAFILTVFLCVCHLKPC